MIRVIAWLALAALTSLAGEPDAARDWMVRWPLPDARALTLLKQIGVRAVWTPVAGTGAAAVVKSCEAAGVEPVAEIESAVDEAALQNQLDAARAAGFRAVAYSAMGDESALRAFVARQQGLVQFVLLKAEQIQWQVQPAHAVLRDGQWPGVRPVDVSVAAASESPWVDSNVYLFAFLRGMFPERAALVSYRPDEEAGVKKERVLALDSLEAALAEAAAAGGRVILTPSAGYREELLDGRPKALAAWKSLSETARFLRDREESFQRPVATRVAVAACSLEAQGEILNMLYRWNATPAVFPAAKLAAQIGNVHRVVVAAGLDNSAVVQNAVMSFAASGGQVLAARVAEKDPAWWLGPSLRKKRAEEDRDVFGVGKGTLYSYKEPVLDPAEFALDVLEAEGWTKRDLRLWNAAATVGILRRLDARRVAVELLNYGSPSEPDFQVRVEGAFGKAVLELPGRDPIELKPIRRGSGTEIELPGIGHFGRLVLE